MTVTIGRFRIDRVVESEEPLVAPEIFFPESTADVFEEHAGWLEPRYRDPASGKLVICVQSYVLRTDRHTILVDGCVGNDKDRDVFPQWNRQSYRYLEDLAAIGLQPDEIDIVMCTHLHTDHVGWNTRLVDGRWVPTFPNARYLFGRREYEDRERQLAAQGPAGHGQAFADSVLPIIEAGLATLIEDDHQIEDGVWLEPAPGHTAGNMIVNLQSDGQRAVISGDVIHHPVQLVRPDWSSRACEDRPASRRTRRALLERCCDTDIVLAPTHFASPSLGRVITVGDRFGYEDVPE